MTSLGLIPIPFLPLSTSLAEESVSALQNHRFRLITLSSWDELVELPSECSVRAIAADSPKQAEVSLGLARLLLCRPNARVFLICRSQGEANPPAFHLSLNLSMAFLPPDAGRLLNLLGRTWADGRAAGLQERIRAAVQIPFVLRVFVRKALENRLVRAPTVTPWILGRNVEALCDASGISRSQVYTQAGKAGIRPKAFVDAWNAVQVLVTRDVENISWLEMEVLSGYQSASGLSSLVHRGVGYTPGNLPTDDEEYWFSWFEEKVLDPILNLGAEEGLA